MEGCAIGADVARGRSGELRRRFPGRIDGGVRRVVSGFFGQYFNEGG